VKGVVKALKPRASSPIKKQRAHPYLWHPIPAKGGEKRGGQALALCPPPNKLRNTEKP